MGRVPVIYMEHRRIGGKCEREARKIQERNCRRRSQAVLEYTPKEERGPYERNRKKSGRTVALEHGKASVASEPARLHSKRPAQAECAKDSADKSARCVAEKWGGKGAPGYSNT